MDPMIFTQAIPRLRVLETRLLDRTKLERMSEASSIDEVFKLLGETEYSNIVANIKKFEDYEEILSIELNRVYKSIYEISPVRSIVDVMSIKYDYHNLKVLIKGKYLNKDFSNLLIPVGRIELSKLKNFIETEYYRDFNKVMRKTLESVIKDFEEKKDPQNIDIIFDKGLYEELKELDKEIGDKFLHSYITSLIDLTNLKTLLRVRKQNKGRDFFGNVMILGGSIDKDKLFSLLTDAPENISTKLSYTNYKDILKIGIESYVKEGTSTVFEKLSEDYIMELMKKAKYVSFGLEPIIAYIYAKETEIKLLRIIMVGKLNNISEDLIKERLREAYV
ncbi:V-type ATP synthase subunit C [Clostridium paridis]|uniref:V-type ATP synthase subunit C n=1 Tax=Clostridium paridis TaxID=2803863 RepID=A0A937FG67_9CLOT|nr:V-type ATP synthase subunit C [Clostridium paridis]MBL4932350.1 V-type ATP synthase subunit C [Clostridium paridis]